MSQLYHRTGDGKIDIKVSWVHLDEIYDVYSMLTCNRATRLNRLIHVSYETQNAERSRFPRARERVRSARRDVTSVGNSVTSCRYDKRIARMGDSILSLRLP